ATATPPVNTNLYSEIIATVKTPQYLADATGKSMLVYGSDNQPQQNGFVDTSIVIHVPAFATDPTKWPLPTVVFGHGLFGSAVQTLHSDVLEKIANDRCAIYIATDWI